MAMKCMPQMPDPRVSAPAASHGQPLASPRAWKRAAQASPRPEPKAAIT